MVFEHEVKCIVMLCKKQERGQVCMGMVRKVQLSGPKDESFHPRRQFDHSQTLNSTGKIHFGCYREFG